MTIQKKDISEAVGRILGQHFEHCEIYSDETQEGFDYPAFFIEIISRSVTESRNLRQKFVTIVITYLPKVYTVLDNMDVSDKIENILGLYILVKNRKLKIQTIEFSHTGDNKEILQTYIRLEYYEGIERDETTVKMQKLIYRDRGSVKEYGTT